MALTEDTLVQFLSPFRMKFANAGAAGTYYVGQLVMHDPADGYVKPVSGSDVADVAVAGIVTKNQTVLAGELVEFEKGVVAMSGALGAAAANELVHFGADQVPTLTEGDTVFGGRVLGNLGDNGDKQWAVEIGYVRSGSTF